MDLFLSATAFAQTPAAPAPGNQLMDLLIMFGGFFLIMYFFIIRPQQKRAKEHANLIAGLKAGDEVVTSGGIIGRVRSVAENFVTLEVSQNTLIKVLKTNVTSMTKPPSTAKGAKA